MISLIHLTDDQIDDALIGDPAPECALHLVDCQDCQLRLAEAGAPIASFNAVSLAWSERRSATMPSRPVLPTQAAWLPRAAWAATVAAVLAVGITVPLAHHAGQSRPVDATHESASPTLMASTGPVDNPVAARDEQITRDNQMLEKITSELNTPADSPDREYGLEAVDQSPALVPSHVARN